MSKLCMSTEGRGDLALLLLRILLGVVFLAHGIQKFTAMAMTIGFFASIGLPAWVAYGIAGLEVATGVLVLLGAAVVPAALLQVATMIGAVALVHGKHGFFAGQGGYEYAGSLLVVALAVALLGPGKYAVMKACRDRSAAGSCMCSCEGACTGGKKA